MAPEKRARLSDDDDADEMPLDLTVEKPREPVVQLDLGVDAASIENNCPEPLLAELSQRPSIPSIPATSGSDIPLGVLAIEQRLTADIQYGIRFAHPVEYLYSPVEYAFQVHAKYVHKYCGGAKKLLFLGMNAGPWGMSQTGVPFGEVRAVADWLKLSGHVGKPWREHPARRVTGFACRRSEVSGKRFWSLVRKLCETPDRFFMRSYLHNYCPVALMDSAGRNITPADLKGIEQRALQILCDDALVAIVKLLAVEKIVCIGRFTEKRAKTVITNAGLDTDVLYIPHPSPRSPSNVNWVEKTAEKLKDLNLLRFFTDDFALSSVNDDP